MISFIKDSNGALDPFMKDSPGIYTTEANPESILLSPPILALTVGKKSRRGVWKILEKRFASISRSHILGLRDELISLKKGTESIDSFF